MIRENISTLAASRDVRHRWMLAAMLSALALWVTGCALSPRSESLNTLSANDQALAGQVRQQALETMPTGRGLSWSSADGRRTGSVTPIATYRIDGSGDWCREYEEMLIVDGTVLRQRHGACRDDSGFWRNVDF